MLRLAATQIDQPNPTGYISIPSQEDDLPHLGHTTGTTWLD